MPPTRSTQYKIKLWVAGWHCGDILYFWLEKFTVRQSLFFESLWYISIWISKPLVWNFRLKVNCSSNVRSVHIYKDSSVIRFVRDQRGSFASGLRDTSLIPRTKRDSFPHGECYMPLHGLFSKQFFSCINEIKKLNNCMHQMLTLPSKIFNLHKIFNLWRCGTNPLPTYYDTGHNIWQKLKFIIITQMLCAFYTQFILFNAALLLVGIYNRNNFK